MSKIEKVIKRLECYGRARRSPEATRNHARDICQLFEPKPDEGRLLTQEEINKAYDDAPEPLGTLEVALVAQDAKTASIKDAECKEMILRAKQSGENDAAFKYEARIEALIEAHHKIAVVLANPLTTRSEPTKVMRLIRASNEAWQIARDALKAIHTSKEKEDGKEIR